MNRSLENTKVKLEPQDSQPPENPPPPEDKSYIVVGWIGLHDDMGASILGKDAIMEGTLRAEPSNELRQTVTYIKWKGTRQECVQYFEKDPFLVDRELLEHGPSQADCKPDQLPRLDGPFTGAPDSQCTSRTKEQCEESVRQIAEIIQDIKEEDVDLPDDHKDHILVEWLLSDHIVSNILQRIRIKDETVRRRPPHLLHGIVTDVQFSKNTSLSAKILFVGTKDECLKKFAELPNDFLKNMLKRKLHKSIEGWHESAFHEGLEELAMLPSPTKISIFQEGGAIQLTTLTVEEEESGEIDYSNDEGISATPSETNDENVAEMHQDDDAPPRQHILVQWVLDSSIERYSIMPNPLMRGANILFDGSKKECLEYLKKMAGQVIVQVDGQFDDSNDSVENEVTSVRQSGLHIENLQKANEPVVVPVRPPGQEGSLDEPMEFEESGFESTQQNSGQPTSSRRLSNHEKLKAHKKRFLAMVKTGEIGTDDTFRAQRPPSGHRHLKLTKAMSKRAKSAIERPPQQLKRTASTFGSTSQEAEEDLNKKAHESNVRLVRARRKLYTRMASSSEEDEDEDEDKDERYSPDNEETSSSSSDSESEIKCKKAKKK